MTATDPLDVAAVKKDFPLLDREVHGKRARLPRLGHTSQKPPRRARRHGRRYYERSNANVHRGIYLIAEEATAALEGARAKVARFIGAPPTREVVFTKNATEALNLVAKAVGPGQPRRRATPSCSPSSSTTPTSSRGTSSHAETGHRAALDPASPPTATSTSPTSTAWSTAPSSSAFTAMSNVLGTITPVERLADAAHAAGALARRRRLPVRAPPRHRRAGLGRRLRRLHRPQDAAAPPASACSGAPRSCSTPCPPFLGGGEMILNVTKDGFTTNELPVEVRGRHAADRRGRRARRRRRLPRPASAWTPCASTRSRSPATPCAPSPSASATTSPSTARASRPSAAACCPSPTATSTPTTSPRCSTSTACASGPATTAPSRSCASSGVGATARASLYVYNDEHDVDALADALAAAADFFAL